MGALLASPSLAASGEIRGKGDECIDIPDGNTKPGTRIHYWPCDGSPEQQWAVQDGRIVGKDGVCLDLPDGNTKDGTRLHIWTCDGLPEQRWEIANGEIRMEGKCLDLPNGATKDGTPIQLWPCDGSAEQKWRTPAATARLDPAEVLGRSMALLVYAGDCKFAITNSITKQQAGALVDTIERLQAKLGVSEEDMEKIGNNAKGVVTPAKCDAVRSNFERLYQETLAMAAQIP